MKYQQIHSSARFRTRLTPVAHSSWEEPPAWQAALEQILLVPERSVAVN